MNGCAKAGHVRQQVKMMHAKIDNMPRFGFIRNKGGVHTARTIMLEDLRLLLSCVSDPGATKEIKRDSDAGKLDLLVKEAKDEKEKALVH